MNKMMFLMGLAGLLVGGCQSRAKQENQAPGLNQIAERYVKTVLQLGQYDPDFVDAYYGPDAWKPSSPPADTFPASRFLQELARLQQDLAKQDSSALESGEKRRLSMFKKQVRAAFTKVEMMQGKKFSFDQEALLLYDARPPHMELSYFDSLLQTLEPELPGKGPLAQRWAAYRKRFVIPGEKLDTVFQAAIAEARRRTKSHYQLPDRESFRVEYVRDKPWSGYNYFKGKGYSLIQINTDFPIHIDRAVDLACHEGYPGHHVFNTLLEQELVEKKGWKELSVYPLFSPQSLIAEGSANYGIEVAFPGSQRLEFEKKVLFPLAGLDPAQAGRYYAILGKISQLNFAGNEAARLYLNGEISSSQAAEMLVKYNFYEPDKALQRIRFMDRYRSYVINYNLGQELVRRHVEKRGGTADKPEKRWQVFQELLANPYTASMLQK